MNNVRTWLVFVHACIHIFIGIYIIPWSSSANCVVDETNYRVCCVDKDTEATNYKHAVVSFFFLTV